jgi:GR25 family glycosyltransferase involved in LPS biosynthesis
MHLEDVPIVVISLDRRPDRWAFFSERAVTAGVYEKIQRLPAVDAKEFVAHEHPAVSLTTAHNIKHGVRRSHHEIDSAGAVGCSLSHFKAWRYLVESSAPALIIFEDDSPLPPDFRERMESMLAELPSGWDMVTLYNTPYQGGQTGCVPEKDRSPWQTCTSLMGAHAYMISRRGAEKLLAKAYPIEMHVDAYFAYMARMGHITLLWNPAMQITPILDDSDINHGGGGILNIPSNMEKHGIVALHTTSAIGVVTMAALVGGLVALAYVVRRKGI